ncbi:MAG: FkbM family methyltransferase [Elainellaceae cyanobacterium]
MYPNLNSIQRNLSKSKAVVNFAIKLRNQLNMIIGYYLGESCDHKLNGEEPLIKTLAPHCKTFVDVGANIGDWTELFLNYCPNECKGLLFEPGATAFKKITEKFSQVTNIKIIPMAVGNETGLIDFFEEPNAGITSSIVKDFASSNSALVRVQITKLDDELVTYGWDYVDYLKIDTEGFDYHVLLGAASFLSQRKLGFIQFEYNKPWANASATLLGALNFLKTYGYVCYLIRSDGLYELNYSLYQEYFRYSNFLAVSLEKRCLIKPLVRGKI